MNMELPRWCQPVVPVVLVVPVVPTAGVILSFWPALVRARERENNRYWRLLLQAVVPANKKGDNVGKKGGFRREKKNSPL